MPGIVGNSIPATLTPGLDTLARGAALDAVQPKVKEATDAAEAAEQRKSAAEEAARQAGERKDEVQAAAGVVTAAQQAVETARQATEANKTSAAGSAAAAQAAQGQVQSLIAGAAAYGTKLSAAEGFADGNIATGRSFFVATGGNAVLYVKGATVETTVPSTNPALSLVGLDAVLAATTAAGQRLPLDGSQQMAGDLRLGGFRLAGAVSLDFHKSATATDDDYVHVIAPKAVSGKQILFLAVNKRTGLGALGALETESLDRLGHDLYGSGLRITTTVADEGGYVDLLDLRTAAGISVRTVAVSKRTGLIDLGALAPESLLRLAEDLYGSGVRISNLVPDEGGYIDLIGATMPNGTPIRSVAVNKRTGLVDIGALSPETIGRFRRDFGSGGSRRLGTASLASVITLIWQAGQSLSIGGMEQEHFAAGEGFWLNPSPYTAYSYMLNTGLRGAKGAIQDTSKIVDFVPAQDDTDTDLLRGQVAGPSMMARLHYEATRRGGSISDMVWRSHGQGGRKISQLQSGSQPFENGVAELARAIAIASDYGRAVELPAIMWTQGEQERADIPYTTKEAYLASLVQLKDSYNSRCLPLLPAGHPSIVMIIDQLNASSYAGPGTPAQIAQYEAAKSLPGFYLACPKYFLGVSDSVHLRAIGYAILGEYQARCWHQVVRLGNTSWKPVMPTSVSRSGTTITLTLNRPYGGNIVFDTTALPQRANYGFEYDGANIVSVAITNAAAGIIAIELDAAAPGTLSYAWTSIGGGYGQRPGAWGNVRDDNLVPAVTLPRVTLPNWLVTFQETVS
ncbi:cell envelope integrity protein TolA [Roseomonas sp. USHLN139]|uniref:cell envelope integrity protein TolA n=1 Tax=Roseomonas sp. USHLN139 TaxID=3081298 RepID=UPI003B0132BA